MEDDRLTPTHLAISVWYKYYHIAAESLSTNATKKRREGYVANCIPYHTER